MSNLHFSDDVLLLFADGEIRGPQQREIHEHLSACHECRHRMHQLQAALADAVRAHSQAAEIPLPAAEGPRALLRARMQQLAPENPVRPRVYRVLAACAAAAAVVAIVVLAPSPERGAIPRADLTPGAVRTSAARDVCAVNLGSNAGVVPAIERAVFAEYGMTGAERRGFEVDYLITPALGGSDDIRNLWPQPYQGSPWNAYVKDALEDHLRDLVCSGRLDLSTAQHEIATNWVAAYRKYFRTRHPLPQHSHNTVTSE